MTTEGVSNGYWEWFTRERAKMRSGHFENGQQVGEWITYDKTGQKYKVSRSASNPLIQELPCPVGETESRTNCKPRRRPTPEESAAVRIRYEAAADNVSHLLRRGRSIAG